VRRAVGLGLLLLLADCDEGPCATENDDVELRVTVTG